jgi:tetratricopeptide (TPR) repeat protein
MKRGLLAGIIGVIGVVVVILLIKNLGTDGQGDTQLSGYTGSSPCRNCHERFYDLWAGSHHGLAMQPVTAEFIETEIGPFEEGLEIGPSRFHVKLRSGKAWVVETLQDQKREFRLHHAMGGKNVYYFLTELERGRLQVLPLGYDVRRKEWFDAPSSMVRHFADASDDPIAWTDRLLTFNTSCYNCHVSQLQTNYDLASDSYKTVWSEPGINCETCHAGAEEHIRVCEEAGEGNVPENLEIISVKAFDKDELNSLCNTCHAKSHVLSSDFTPGDRYFDHFGLTAFEDTDFYPDGRDLGENFTMTLWLTSPCLDASDLDCLHCHTSSGRFRQKDQPNDACLPCHQDKVTDLPAHTHHETDSPGSLCISCHMPMTEFARMRRSDHSMRPPTPAATMEFGSPNACNLCHEDRDATWADGWVRKWRSRDYQAPVLMRARLVQEARDEEWKRLPEMLAYIESENRDPVYATSLIRLMQANSDERIRATLLRALTDRSPLVRAAAAEALGPYQDEETRGALLTAAGDDYRVVRISTAQALSSFPAGAFQGIDLGSFPAAIADYEAYLDVRPDDWLSHYNRGNYLLNIGRPELAIDAYQTAHRLDPNYYPPLVNASIAYNQVGDNAKAEESLRTALRLEPYSDVVWLNLALLLGEQGRRDEAMEAFGTVFELDSTSAVAAYNLSVFYSETDMGQAVEWSERAAALDPESPRYSFTHAFYLNQAGDNDRARRVLEDMIQDYPAYADAYLLLGDVYLVQGKRSQAIQLYERGLGVAGMPAEGRAVIGAKLEAVRNG